ncbi:MAG: TonB-dependent receptor, partial [Verrucomicrobiae bacterium]|nr:TonB-dependent receptor [Verrucomicrobiae bacterium]
MTNNKSVFYLYQKALLPAAIIATIFPLQSFAANEGIKTSNSLEEIVVTARKREESLMDTPVSITAFSGEELVNRNLVSIDQIGAQTPGLVFSSSANISGSSNAASVFIRGIGQSDYTLAVEPGVGIYIDDVYLPHSIGNVANVVDVERIEVLRGPQGTLFGRNTIGGAIRVVTKKPNEEHEGNIEFTIGSDDRIDIKGHANIPITDTFFMRFSALSQDRDGFVSRPFLDGDSGDKDSVNLIAQARWLVSDNFTADLMLGIDRDDSEGAPMVALAQDPNHPAGTQPTRFRDFIAPFVDPAVLQGMLQGFTPSVINDPDGSCCHSFSNTDIPSDMEGENATLTLSWDINDNLNFKSITAYRSLESRFGRDADNLPFNQQVELFLSVDYDVWSQELQFSGTAMDDRLDWTVGAYYFYEDGVEDDLVAFASFDITSGGFFSTEDYALFAQGTFDVTDKLSLTLGVRYTDEEKEAKVDGARHQGLLTGFLTSLDAMGSKANVAFGPGLPFPLVPVGTYVENVEETVPYLNLSYQWTDNLMVYASYSEGFKGGGIQVRNGPLPFLPQFDPEFVESYEVGLKWSGLDGRLNLSMAAYTMDYDGVQLPGIVFQPELGNAVSVVENLGDAKNEGF